MMADVSLYPPLPPNRKVRQRRARNAPVEAPDETTLMDGAEAGQDFEAGPSPGQGRGGRFLDALRLIAGVIVTVGAALLCVWGLLRYTRTSPRFSIRTIQVQGNVHRSPEDIARLGALVPGHNIFATDLEVARSGILEDPWIESVTLRRRLPSTVSVEIVEREAHAFVAVGPDIYLSTRQGELFKKPEPGDPQDLPVITGTRPEEVARDRAAALAMIKRALDLLSEYERTAPAKTLAPQEVHLEDDGGLVLVVGKDAMELRLGRGPYRQSLEQASRVLGELTHRKAQASVVFLDNEAHPERVVVRMR
jgi:cell division protein FtsQ